VISIVACCHSVKHCAHAARDFRSQQNCAVTRMWRLCQVQLSHKECVIGVVRCKKRGCCCNLSGGVALHVWFTTNGLCAKNNTHIYCMWREQAIIIEWSWYVISIVACCYSVKLLRTCRSCFPIATVQKLLMRINSAILWCKIANFKRHFANDN